jgi:acyl carrier protein
MTPDERLTEIFRDVFEDDDIELHDEMTAADVDGWDSIAHINLIVAIEEGFGVRFSDRELGSLADVGSLRRTLHSKLETNRA